MFKKLLKNKLSQSVAEYSLLISLVVAAVIAMQTYAQRALQARIRGATIYMTNETKELGTDNQYEAYYQQSDYDIDRQTTDTTVHNNSTISLDQQSSSNRSGNSSVGYDTSMGVINGI